MSPNVNIPFRGDATEASLVPDPLGWCLVLISASGREPIIASRTDVAEAVLNQSPSKRAHIPDYFEDRIRAAGYGSSRMTPEPGAIAAWRGRRRHPARTDAPTQTPHPHCGLRYQHVTDERH
jgi:hypothetical protein